ncbi:ubiquitin carboxyl-terminal hydrolase 20-like [Actinia tenebrosa]|uniref:Ubiquitin carboxyl-terminal hydrolase n=1 Tax=Actinia tenebrosa TaxID=6105 RepID=A0A6P8JCS8_ACTTE|nr:ubiquitin carboxyl-terminal hydrolase 20-like [Actinia tenebrosa]
MSCPHQVFMKKINPADLKMMRTQGSCNKCDKKGNDLWACLQDCCLYIGCGKCNRNHIELHNQETDHHLCINLDDYKVWCFSCQSSVDSSSSGSGTPSPEEMEVADGREKTTNYKHRNHDILDDDDFLDLEQGLKPRGLCGLMNIGNTCYMNAALQALSNCPPLTQFFLECNGMINENIKHPGLSRNFYSLINELWSRKRPKYIVPSQFLRSVRIVNSQFRGYGQQDAQEFLRCIMDRLHEELKQPIMSYSRVSCDTSDESDEPNHQAKRLLGGTSVLARRRHGQDIEMLCESSDDGDDSRDKDSEMPLDKRRSSAVLDTSDVQIDIEMEEEQTETEKSKHSEKLIANSYSNGKCVQGTKLAEEEVNNKPSFSDKKPESAALTSEGQKTKENKHIYHEDHSAEVIKKTSTYRSIITDLFDGKVQSSVQCLTCNRISSKIETFQDLSLPIPGKDELNVIHAAQCSPLASCARRDDLSNDEKSWMMSILDWVKRWFYGPQVTLQDCLSAFFSADELKGDNMYSCEKCKKLRNGIKLCKVLKLPEILCVHLKRFKHEMYFSSKISHFISFPTTSLDMKHFLAKDYRSSMSHKPSTTYDLVAVISHHGSVGAGHYIAFAKNYISNKWYEFNDSWVSEVSESYVSEVEAYVLFYRKTSEMASKERQWLFNMIRNPQSSVQCFYVSKFWFTKFQTCAEPGPITNTDFVCEHGEINPKNHCRIKDLVTAVPEVVWTHIYNRYGGGPVVTRLDICEQCEILIDKLDRRRDEEVENFKKLYQQFPAAENVDVYCISMKWFRQWEAFVKGREEDPPGPIDNRNIITVRDNTRILKSNADYDQVSLETWNYLNGIYAGGPTFVLEAETEEQEV